MARGAPEVAEQLFSRSLEILDAAGAVRSANRANVMNSLGMVRLDLGDPEGAASWLQESVDIFSDLGDPDGAAARGNLGRALDRVGRHREAEIEHRAALEMYRSMGSTDSAIPSILSNLAICVSSQGRLDEAAEIVAEARTLWRSVPGAEIEGAKVEANLARLLIVAGRPTEAVELAASAAAVLNETAPGSTSAIATEANLGWALAMSGDLDQALPLLERVVDELAARFGADHVVTARGRTLLGAALHRAGRTRPALRQLEHAVRVVGGQPFRRQPRGISWWRGRLCAATSASPMRVCRLPSVRLRHTSRSTGPRIGTRLTPGSSEVAVWRRWIDPRIHK